MVDTPLRGTHSVVVLGGKGGAGKTTTTVGIGSMLARVRNDKVVAIDGNPDVGANLAERIDPTTVSSYREVLAAENLERYADMRSHVGQSRAAGWTCSVPIATSAIESCWTPRHISPRTSVCCGSTPSS